MARAFMVLLVLGFLPLLSMAEQQDVKDSGYASLPRPAIV
jgi:hypothetical protein